MPEFIELELGLLGDVAPLELEPMDPLLEPMEPLLEPMDPLLPDDELPMPVPPAQAARRAAAAQAAASAGTRKNLEDDTVNAPGS